MNRRKFLQGVIGVGVCAALPTAAYSQLLVPDLTQLYSGYQVRFVNTHSHSTDSDAVSGSPGKIIRANLKRFDGVVLTDHGEQISRLEWEKQGSAARHYCSNDKVALRGFEWTDPIARLDIAGNWTPNPAYVNSLGHVVVLRTAEYCGVKSLKGGQPEETGKDFGELLRWIAKHPAAMGIFAHPSLYPVETTFNGFAAPPRNLPTIVKQFVGCELHRIGDGKEMRSSDEACFRQLLRVGWKPAPVIGGDEHRPPYGITVGMTGLYVHEWSPRGFYDALWNRRCFATEDQGSSIHFAAWSDDHQPVIMGRSTPAGRELTVYAEVSTKLRLERISLVLVSSLGSDEDVIIRSQRLAGSQRFGDIVSGDLCRSRKIVCAYARGEMVSQTRSLPRQIIGAPIWLT